ncbi:RidA family protein [Tahibacter amnicola]|uniref:RidA family protein n=1 Tax=Tahibacter amnicola TaxID=2976241 RepID=A0ABY6BG97_9GAMM|nr:RidA family protein [Tahibacter amnicola]UXI68807.1 RidA family protein [Tahibacter amnicola]
MKDDAPMDGVDAIGDCPPSPLGNYRAVVVRGSVGAVSGQLPIEHDVVVFRGRVGRELDVQQGYRAAALCARNVVAQLRHALHEAIDRVALTRITGYVASAPGFIGQAAVIDGASDVLVAALGDRGTHARAAVGVSHLPAGAAVELVVEFVLQ